MKLCTTLLICFLVLFICTSKEEKMVGTWVINDFTYEPEIPSDEDIYTNNLVFSRKFMFSKNGVLNIEGDMVKSAAGSFKIKKDSLFLKYEFKKNDDEGKRRLNEKYLITKLNSNEMIWEQDIEGWAISKFYFTRID